MLQSRNLTIALLLVLLIGTIAPAAGANPPLYLSPSTASVQPSTSNPETVRVLSSAADGFAFDVAASWEQLVLEQTTANGKTYVQVSLPGWASTGQAGAPSLPFAAEAIAAPHGATVTVRVTPGKAHTMALSAPPLPAPTQMVAWEPPAGEAAPALPEPTMVIEEDPAIYAGAAAYPATLTEIASDGLLRQQRVVGIAIHPVQYDPAAQALTVYESLRVEIAFERAASAETLRQAPAQDAAGYEEFFRGKLLNYEAGRSWRSSALPSIEAAATGEEMAATGAAIDTIPWAPPAPGWRVTVQEDGFYKLTYAELQEAGLPVDSLVPSTFKLYNLGREVAIQEEGDGDSLFENGESLLFYGQAIASKYATHNVYWLTYDPLGTTAGLRIGSRPGAPGGADMPVDYGAQRHMEQNTVYISPAPGDENLDRWFWTNIYATTANVPKSWSHTFPLVAPYGGDATATLRVSILGRLANTINPDHHVVAYVNDTQIGELWWDGITWQMWELEFAQSLLRAGNNTLTLTCPNDTGVGIDLVYVDWLELDYANTFLAENDELAFTYAETGSYARHLVDGFSTDQVAVYDVSDPAAVTQITGVSVAVTASGYAAQFQDTLASGAAIRYRAVADTAYRTVQAETDIEADTASNLRATTNAADHIIISHKDFLAQAAVLRNHRAAPDLRAMAVDVQDVYDEFGYGLVSPAAIHDFLAYAYATWQAPAPSYVVLLGDGHYDPKNYVYPRTSYIPPYLAPVDPWIGETAADNRYVTVDGADTLPDMMLGRLAVNSAAEASVFVNKIIAYESNLADDWQQRVLAVADNADSGGSFSLISDDLLAAHLPAPYTAERVYYGVTHTDAAVAKAAVQAGFNAGALIVNYVGHGYTSGWASEYLLTTSDVPLLQNGANLPVVLSMTCRDGYYHYPHAISANQEALAEVITRADGRGAVGSWSPTGLGVASGHDHLDRGFFDAVFTAQLGTVGAGTAAGKLDLFATGSNLDLLDTFLLFGDPATQLHTVCVALPAVSHLYIALVFGPQVRLDWTAIPGALNYQVWWNATNPYFVPDTGTPCTEANGCTLRPDTTFTHAGGTGSAAVNNSYLVLPVSACGTGQETPKRVGEFDFALVPGD